MFEEQEIMNNPGKEKQQAAPPAKLPVAEPEDVLATVDSAASKSSSRPTQSVRTEHIPDEYLETRSGVAKRIFLVVLGLALIAGFGGAGYWFFAVRQPAASPNKEMNNGALGEVNATPDLVPKGPEPKDFNEDSDADGLSVENEDAAGTDVNNPDTDGDGLFDGEEVRIYGTNPLSVDTDADTFNDADEVRNGFNPKGEGRLFNVPQQ